MKLAPLPARLGDIVRMQLAFDDNGSDAKGGEIAGGFPFR
jgi:hypothetical protein